MKLILRLDLQLLFISLITATEIRKCKHGNLPISVRVEGCDKLPCKFKAGTNATIEADFTIDKQTTTLKPEVALELMGISHPVELPESLQDACKYLINTQCPLNTGSTITYKLSMFVEHEWILPFKSTFKVTLFDGNQSMILCFKADGIVVK